MSDNVWTHECKKSFRHLCTLKCLSASVTHKEIDRNSPKDEIFVLSCTECVGRVLFLLVSAETFCSELDGNTACGLMLVRRNAVYRKCSRFPKAFFSTGGLASPRISEMGPLLFFPLHGCIFRSLQVGQLFTVGFASSGIKPRAFAAICFALDTFARDCRPTQRSHQQLECGASSPVNVPLERKAHTGMMTLSARRYANCVHAVAQRALNWILHEAVINVCNPRRSLNRAVIRFVLPCRHEYGPSSAQLSYSSPGRL